ncbi:hypothetical protein CY0110_16187 [Crocosphaera chwakensis CCY0110]|uniref:Uncharacterized protein n=1 Tax=Crocosphaera chwakensis CCY0110 TaxID=391612 RepID=A3IHR9_9CHRO|nr:hypothetical protein CY0110_16187 [Crocosphaera chwakensis CCY0110]
MESNGKIVMVTFLTLGLVIKN